MAKRIGFIIWILAVIAFVASPVALLFAGTPKQRAAAAVAVARARLAVADDHASLEERQRSNAPTPIEEVVPPRVEDVPIPEDAIVAEVAPMPPVSPAIVVEPSRTAMSMSFPKIDKPHTFMPAQLVVEVWEKGCPYCVQLEKDIRDFLTPRGWVIGDGPECQIRFVKIPQTKTSPFIYLEQNGVRIAEWKGYQNYGMLSNRLKSAWDSAASQPQPSQGMFTKPTIHAKAEIRKAIQLWRQYAGPNAKAQIIWDRSGNANFPLLAKGDWSGLAIFGNNGHLQIECPNAIAFPTKSIGLGYRAEGSAVIIKTDDLRFEGLLDKLGVSRSSGYQAGPKPAGLFIIDDFLLLTGLIEGIQTMMALFQPSLDIILSNQIDLSITLVGDTFNVEFNRAPQIRFVEVFSNTLTLKNVAINDSNVHVDCDGSWWVPNFLKHQDLPVAE